MNDSAVDRYIASNLGRLTPRELAEQTGFTEAEVVQKANEYYDSLVITAHQKRAKLLMQLEDVANEAIERGKNSNSRDSSGNLNSATAAIKALNKEIDDAAKREVASQDEAYSRILVRIVEKSFDRSLGELKARFPETDTAEIESAFRKHLLEVSSEFDGAA